MDELLTDYTKRVEDLTLTLKEQLRGAYLAGVSVSLLAKAFKMSRQNVYFHIGELTSVEKSIHNINKKASY
jgi:hypothetical protein